MKQKILTEAELVNSLSEIRTSGRRVVHCHGVFDLFHLGHLRYLEASRRLGDALVVSITSDRFVNKGPGRPVFSSEQRAEILSSLSIVDFVVINDSPTALPLIKALKPDIYAKGSDYADASLDITGNIEREKSAVREIGGEFAIIREETFSSSQLINEHLSPFSFETNQWLQGFKRKFTPDESLDVIERLSGLRVLVLGESIFDEYVTCEALGKSSKDPVLAFREKSFERHLGGAISIARHCAGLGAAVTLCSQLGGNPQDEVLVRDVIDSEMTSFFEKLPNAPTITKRRYVDEASGNRVFETYVMSDEQLSEAVGLAPKVEQLMSNGFDVVLVCDYGHGFFTDALIALLSSAPMPVALNVQSNAGNRGFNTISKYTKADFACMNGGELALEVRRKHIVAEALVPEIKSKLEAKSVIVTEGSAGLLILDKQGVTRYPAFAPFVKDRVGAGDALFAMTSMTQALGAPTPITGFLGNLAGAAAVAQLGNQNSLRASDVARHTASLLK